MYEDAHLEFDYESRNGSDVDTAMEDERMSAYDDYDDVIG